jgi:CAI-1 autoinducer synthase
LNRGLRSIGFDIDSESQIFGIDTGDVHNTLKIRNFFEGNGVFGSVFCPPATPHGKHLIRFSINSGHSKAELNRVLEVCQRAWDNPDLSFS